VAKGNKFGTFGGVFTPSILTILGVIMYLRLPWIVGQAGLWASIGIILIAHVISVTTGLSVASIATDKSVEAGGPYYIVSRSLGLPLGGTLGLALAVGLSFSISLYIIGFCESLLGYLQLEPSLENIRLYGTLTLIGLTLVTLISTSLAIKTQYLILIAILASLVSIFLGDGDAVLWKVGPIAPDGPHLTPNEGIDAVPMATLFGIFFPAVTGFTAGVNMSGDLKDAKRSIPRGTIAAIAVGLITYVGLAIFFAVSVDPELLRNDKNILLSLSLLPEAVIAGIWGATLSSALGSILGAPRIFQALALDRVIPKAFATGHGKTNEPRTALIIAFVLAEAGILIAELDAIAAIVSMFFMATYGFLNLSCAVESWASPDFRPEFRIPRWVSVLGAVICVLLMVQLEPLATAAAVALLAALFAWLKRRELVLESGDTWGGVWASLARSALQRLDRGTRHVRNWRPNILLFQIDDVDSTVFDFGHSLIGKRGVLTEFDFTSSSSIVESEDDLPGIFRRRLPTESPWTAADGACRFHGFSGVEPNTVLLSAKTAVREFEAFSKLSATVDELDYNLVVFDVRRPDILSSYGRLDLWWDDGNTISWIISVTRFLTASEQWHRTRIRVMVPSYASEDADRRFKLASRYLRDARISAEIRIVYPGPNDISLLDLVVRESDDAALTVVSLPQGSELLSGYIDALPAVLLSRPASLFNDEDSMERRLPAGPPVLADEIVTQESVAAPSAVEVSELFQRSQIEQQSLLAWFETCVVTAAHADLTSIIAESRKTVQRQFQLLGRPRNSSKVRLKRAVSRAQTALLFQGQKIMRAAGETLPADWRNRVSSAASTASDATARLLDLAPGMLDVYPNPDTLRADTSDETHIKKLKAKRRRVAWLTRSQPSISIPARGLSRHWLVDQTAHGFQDTLSELTVSTIDTVFATRRVLIDATLALEKLAAAAEDTEGGDVLSEERDAVLSRFDELDSRVGEQADALRRKLRRNGKRHLASFAYDLTAIDAIRRLRQYRQASVDVPQVEQFAEPIATNLALVFGQVANGLTVASFAQRLRTIVDRTQASVALHIESGTTRELERLHQQMSAGLEELGDGKTPNFNVNLSDVASFDDERVVGDLVQEISIAIRELPASIRNLDHARADALDASPLDAVEPRILDLRRLVQFVIEGDLIGGVRAVLSRIPAEEQRARETIQDVFRLLAFHTADTEQLDDERDSTFISVVESALTRIEGEQEHLADLNHSVKQRFTDVLNRVSERLDTWCRTGAPEALQARKETNRGLTGMDRLTRTAGAAARNVIARTIYQRNREAVARMSDHAMTKTSAAESVLGLVHELTPRADILESLPFYYYQLFLGQSVLDKAFWVGRSNELERLSQAVESWRSGYGGGALIVGERLSGRGSFARYAIARDFPIERTVVVPGPTLGNVSIEDFDIAIQKAAGVPGSTNEVLRRLPERTVVHLRSLERWWERRTGGFEVLEHITDLIDRHGQRCFFVMDMNVHAYRFASQYSPIADSVLSVVETGPMSAADLESIITLRHQSTGLYYTMDSKHEDDLAEWKTARLFEKHFEASGGRVGAALQSWINSVRRVRNDELRMAWPRVASTEPLHTLSTDTCTLLVQLTLHQCADRQRLQRVTGLPEIELKRQLSALRRMGLLQTRHDGAYETNRYVDHLITAHLRDQGMLT
jgi:amino acid transporter